MRYFNSSLTNGGGTLLSESDLFFVPGRAVERVYPLYSYFLSPPAPASCTRSTTTRGRQGGGEARPNVEGQRMHAQAEEALARQQQKTHHCNDVMSSSLISARCRVIQRKKTTTIFTELMVSVEWNDPMLDSCQHSSSSLLSSRIRQTLRTPEKRLFI